MFGVQETRAVVDNDGVGLPGWREEAWSFLLRITSFQLAKPSDEIKRRSRRLRNMKRKHRGRKLSREENGNKE